MNQSENINEISTALSKAQGEMPAAIKDSTNPFFKSKYADFGSVKEAAQPSLSKYGLCVVQTTDIIPGTNQVVLISILAHSSGQWFRSCLPVNPSKADCQGMGAALTYLKRYAFCALVGVVTDEDDDGETAVGRGKSLPQPKPMPVEKQTLSEQQLSIVNNLVNQLDDDSQKGFHRWIRETYGCENLKDVPSSVFDRCLTVVNAKLKMQAQMAVA